MKKVIVILVIFSLVFISFFLFKKEEEKENENISIIIETNEGNIEASTYPDKEYYEYSNINCKNTSDNIYVNFNKETWKLNLSVEEEKVDGKFNCIVHFKQRNRLGTEVITSKYKENNNDGLIKLNQPETEQTPELVEYRYSGSNEEVKNYVEFNNEIWRIIGVFPVDDGTGKYEERLKIIREESIGNYSFDSTSAGINDFSESTGGTRHIGAGSNQWGNSVDYEGADLMRLLNPGYESESINNSLYWNGSSGTCYNEENNTTIACDFTSVGLSCEARDMIGEAKWYLGAKSYDTTTIEAYKLERGSNLPSPDIGRDITKTVSWIGKVAIAYPSDYGYASKVCYSNTSLSDYYLEKCLNSNYLSNNFQWRLISPNNTNSFSTSIVSSTGANNGLYAAKAYGVRPTLYLKESIKIISGNGTIENPYQLSL